MIKEALVNGPQYSEDQKEDLISIRKWERQNGYWEEITGLGS